MESAHAPGTTPVAPRGLPGPGVRPNWQTSEATATRTLKEAGFREQVSFRGGKEVPYGTPDSVRPDQYSPNYRMSVDVKNYNLETPQGRSRLVHNVAGQAQERAANLPPGTRQGLLLDLRGQKPDPRMLEKMLRRIARKTGGLIERDNIAVLGDGE